MSVRSFKPDSKLRQSTKSPSIKSAASGSIDSLSVRRNSGNVSQQKPSIVAEQASQKNVKTQKKPRPAECEEKKWSCVPKKQPKRKTPSELAIQKFKNIDFTDQGSTLQLTVQTLEFPDANVKRTELHKRDVCGYPLVSGKTGLDFGSSSDSHFRNAVEPVKLRRRTCSSSTATSVKTSRAASQRPSTKHHGFVNSQEMIDSQHAASTQPENLHGDEWEKPCSADSVVGAPRPRIGVCPKTYAELAKLSPSHQKFYLTQDPRKTHCLVNPQVLRYKNVSKLEEFKHVSKTIQEAGNVCQSTETDTSESHLCEVIDLQNPLGLDFQGMDYMINYEKDEQELQNQLAYWKVTRYMDRKRVKDETESKVEKQLKEERTAIPAAFHTTIKDETVAEPAVVKTQGFSQLYRRPDKPLNKQKIEAEHKRRTARYRDIYLRNKERQIKQEFEKKQADAEAKETAAHAIAEKDLAEEVAVIDDAIDRSFRKKAELETVIRKRKFYPKTLTETNRLKKKMLREKCIERDKAKVQQKYYMERTGKFKKFPNAQLSMDCPDSVKESLGSTPSEQSSDDEDYLQVGKVGDVFKLRGFHFKHGEGLRGKLHRHQILQGQRTVKGCLTRDEWLNQLVPKKEPIKLDVEKGIIKLLEPDDPNLDLFPAVPIIKAERKGTSAVREYINKPLGEHYHRKLRKNLKFVKPKLKYNVKKFNLIRYVFPDKKLNSELDEKHEELTQLDRTDHLDPTEPKSTAQYVALKKKIAKAAELKENMTRMKLLGLPCEITEKERLESPCKKRVVEYSKDWVPTPEPSFHSHESSESTSEQEERKTAGEERVPLEMRGNMPAPDFREYTLFQHPRRKRDYRAERVPSALFNETINISDKPLMEKLSPDKIKFANIRSESRPYTKMLEGRHHHDHWDPTHSKKVQVHYQAKIVYPQTTHVPEKTKKKTAAVKMPRASPPCKEYFDKDLTMPVYDFDKLIDNHLAATRKDTKTAAGEVVQDICIPHEFVFHSRDPEELEQLNYPGRQKYIEFLHETREALYEAKDNDNAEEHLMVDRKVIEAEMEEDLKSIDACLSSLSSSECTNLTNDSGSFLVLNNKTKLPLDYIRKPLVPFEELYRSRFQAEVIDVDAEDRNPFRLLPFAGQLKEQIAMLAPKDSFYTFSTRLRSGLRLRLEVPVPDVRNVRLGDGRRQFYGAVITDLDEYYIDELKRRATVKTFNFKTGVKLLKDAMRLKYESLVIQGQIVRNKIFDRINEQHWDDMLMTKQMYEALFARWEKREYTAAMAVVYKVKSYYETTDRLKSEHRNLERELMMLNMDIVFIEGHWIRCVMLQNFHYLLGEEEWRLENDWIHRVHKHSESDIESEQTEDGKNKKYQLEPYDESIAKRAIVNIRVRDKDDAWAIRSFYYEVYMKNMHPILQVFPDAQSFLLGIANLKNRTFVLLLEMHFTLSIHTEIQGRLETFIDWCAKDLKEKQDYVARRSAKKFFMEDRAREMELRVFSFMDKPLELSFADDEFNKIRGIIAEVWRRVVPAAIRGSSDVLPNGSDMVAAISDVVLDLLAKFESIDIEKARELEAELRKRRRYYEKLSAQAYHVERRIEMEMRRVKRNLEPPYKPPKRVGRLPRLYLKKKVKKEVTVEATVSDYTRNFLRAFRIDDDEAVVNAKDTLSIVDNLQDQIVPFYFDHFLKLNGYTPNYNFKTSIELRDGPETERFRVRSAIPDVLQKLEYWEYMRKRTMEEHIQRNPKMYEDVV